MRRRARRLLSNDAGVKLKLSRRGQMARDETGVGKGRNEPEAPQDQSDDTLVERGLAYGRALRARVEEGRSPVADKAFIDSLYER